MIDIKKVADNADLIVSGYAFTKDNNLIKVLNLNNPAMAAVFKDDEIIETTMPDIELEIVKGYYKNDRVFMEG